MKEPKFTYEKLIENHDLRADFFAFIDEQRELARKAGFRDAVKLHNINAKRIAEDLAQYD
ncbi:hypothetical protein [Sinorhizobium meliloti]|uniref:hypothetical protein n=1 Tax=Rhizobium meliloti TaxID=382 RepID=UPI000FD76010|nr:hypothetical protein [Sinorhizobium meliloti]MDX0370631.1 hypothetical protein [Sinorhizobium meliloti]RVM26281.1 hypothetical protein CN132_16605 [Sinorhizobium meliloti]